MATITEMLADELITELKKQKRPRVYCIARYWNTVFDTVGYAMLDNEVQYQALRTGVGSDRITVLWASPRFRKTHGSDAPEAIGSATETTVPILCCAECGNPLYLTTNRGSYCMTCRYTPSLQDTYFVRLSPCCGREIAKVGDHHCCPGCYRTYAE